VFSSYSIFDDPFLAKSSMAQQSCYLAVDVGAESGRIVAGLFDGSRLSMREVYRFPNQSVAILGHSYWEIYRLFAEIREGIARAASTYGRDIASVGVDTWGVDYGLLDRTGHLVGSPYIYRDKRTDGMMDEAFRRLSREELYRHTGIQFMFFNTIYQLLSEVVENNPRLDVAESLLFIPDLLNYWLSGVQANERTIASTSQLLDPRTGRWSTEVIAKLGLPGRLFRDIVEPGTVLGPLLPDLLGTRSGESPRLVASAGHDTAAAVAAVPGEGDSFAYLSSGTWSLMGVETLAPVLSEKAYAYNFTNEGGVAGTIRLLANISGLWLIQECRRTWASGGKDYTYEELSALANEAPPFIAVIDPDYGEFSKPGNMPENIRGYCRKTGQRAPDSPGSIVRTALEGLALKYRFILERLDDLTGHHIDALNIVGGGTQNTLLNQFTADAVNRPVITGPIEATSIGNILVQMMAMGKIGSLREGRELVRRSVDTTRYRAGDPDRWEGPFVKLKELIALNPA
jgi:rhamnulokinase